jgi:hypothetical protein
MALRLSAKVLGPRSQIGRWKRRCPPDRFCIARSMRRLGLSRLSRPTSWNRAAQTRVACGSADWRRSSPQPRDGTCFIVARLRSTIWAPKQLGEEFRAIELWQSRLAWTDSEARRGESQLNIRHARFSHPQYLCKSATYIRDADG